MASLVHDWKPGGQIFSVSVSPDGSRIAAACDTDVVILSADNGTMVLGPLKGHTSSIWSVAFSPDGRTLASGSYDHTIRIWSAETGKDVMEPLTGHTASVESVVFTPDGQLLVSGSYDRTIRLWDTRNGQPTSQTINTGSHVNSVAVSPDGTKIAAGCYDRIIRTYDATTRSLLFQCVGHTGLVLSVKISPDGQRIASGSADGTVRLWDGATGHAIGDPLLGHTDYVRSVSFSSDGRYLASASDDETLRIWDTESGKMEGNPLSGHTHYVYSTAFLSRQAHLISGSYDCTIKIWHLPLLLENTQPVDSSSSIDPEDEESDVEVPITPTTIQGIIEYLYARGCADLSDKLDLSTCGDHPVSSGGTSDMYRCTMSHSKAVVIKAIRSHSGNGGQSQEEMKEVTRKIYVWSKCWHPNVQPLLGLVLFRDRIGLAAAWESNGSLPEYLERHPEVDRYVMGAQVAWGLSYLHSCGVVHGSIKGTNVLVSKKGVAQLADFGLATLQSALQSSSNLTKATMSLRWAAPELFEGARCSFAADVYALGMTILEILTGQVPWAGKSEHAVMYSVMFKKECPARPTRELPGQSSNANKLWDILCRCWKFEAEARPSADDVGSVLREMTKSKVVLQ